VEEAVRLKEKGTVSEIVVVSVGPKEAQEQIRSAMALGAQNGLIDIFTLVRSTPLLSGLTRTLTLASTTRFTAIFVLFQKIVT
jgi:hypothetical protein